MAAGTPPDDAPIDRGAYRHAHRIEPNRGRRRKAAYIGKPAETHTLMLAGSKTDVARLVRLLPYFDLVLMSGGGPVTRDLTEEE